MSAGLALRCRVLLLFGIGFLQNPRSSERVFHHPVVTFVAGESVKLVDSTTSVPPSQ